MHKETIMKQFILHIPHSQTFIPDYSGYQVSRQRLKAEINLLTDWATDQIYDIPGQVQLIVPFSRVFCDVERFYDEFEPMAKKGAGIAYTKCDSGERLRVVTDNLKTKIIKDYYLPHQAKLNQLAKIQLERSGQAIIIDCHSFSSTPLKREFQQTGERPDICIGTDKFHTPPNLADKVKRHFLSTGLSVSLNQPYSGCMVPGDYYQKDKRVQSIMIEINKKLYMDEVSFKINQTKVKSLNQIVTDLLNGLV